MTGAAGAGIVTFTADWHAAETWETFFRRHCSASRPPGVTPEQRDMKSERQDERIAFCCSLVICAGAAEAEISVSSATATCIRTTPAGAILIPLKLPTACRDASRSPNIVTGKNLDANVVQDGCRIRIEPAAPTRISLMPMDAGEIERLIKASIPDARVTIRDLAGDGDHYAATVISASFKGKSRVQQHQTRLQRPTGPDGRRPARFGAADGRAGGLTPRRYGVTAALGHHISKINQISRKALRPAQGSR